MLSGKILISFHTRGDARATFAKGGTKKHAPKGVFFSALSRVRLRFWRAAGVCRFGLRHFVRACRGIARQVGEEGRDLEGHFLAG